MTRGEMVLGAKRLRVKNRDETTRGERSLGRNVLLPFQFPCKSSPPPPPTVQVIARKTVRLLSDQKIVFINVISFRGCPFFHK